MQNRLRGGNNHGIDQPPAAGSAKPAPWRSTAPPAGTPAPSGIPVSTRGHLKIYLGATPGAGKTFAMLREAHDLARAGHDVVVAYVETYNRPRTVELLEGLEIAPRATVSYKGATLADMDLEWVLNRKPEVALVDELAHTNAPGLKHHKRWQDVETLRDAGINVISTVNVQHVESVKDLVEKVTGIAVRETVPDKELDTADVVQFIDIAPEALRKRMRHGNIYAKDKVDAALENFFRPANLAAMRQIGLRLVAVSGASSSEELMRRGARLARRRGGFCLVVTVVSDPAEDVSVDRYRQLAQQLGCSFAVLAGDDPAHAIIRAAHDAGSDHVVVGETTSIGWRDRLRPNLVDRIIDGLPHADIHVIARLSK